jgi:hypothetical protein
MRQFFTMYEEAVIHDFAPILLNFLIYEEYFIFIFISVCMYVSDYQCMYVLENLKKGALENLKKAARENVEGFSLI